MCNSNRRYLVCEHDPCDTLWVPKQLIYIIITNDAIVVTLPPYKLAVHRLVTLITNETVERLDNGAKVEAFRHGIDAVLAFGRAVIVVRAFENEAETLGDESDLGSLSPAEEIEGYLSHTVVLGHVIHRLAPAFEGADEGLFRVVSTAAAL